MRLHQLAALVPDIVSSVFIEEEKVQLNGLTNN